MDIERIKKSIRNVPDFPQPGIQFKDITPILQVPKLFSNVIDIFYDRYKNEKNDVIGTGFPMSNCFAFLKESVSSIRLQGIAVW